MVKTSQFLILASYIMITCQGFHCSYWKNDQSLTKLKLILKPEKILSSESYETILDGKIAIIPEFLSPHDLESLRSDAKEMWNGHYFTTDALASYGTSGTFDPSRDRSVVKLKQWKDSSLGSFATRQSFGSRMADIRADLAYHLNRPELNRGLATTQYGYGSTEISYTRFGPGAYLKRHVDEHHEELKDTAGWMQPTRRSLSWLIYLNENDWDMEKHGGALRVYPRSSTPVRPIGANSNGDLQVAWARPVAWDPFERPVFLSRLSNHKCVLYIRKDENDVHQRINLTPEFDSHPILYVAGSELLTRKLLLEKHWADRFQLIEPPKSKLDDLMRFSTTQDDSEQQHDSTLLADVNPIGGTLVIFDSVALPHEVMLTKQRERWATSGWFHEDQQEPAREG
jgi:Rps23 Pro-64 3,4-dihydroxylase Tpa1-like proline 4-hydroxylase